MTLGLAGDYAALLGAAVLWLLGGRAAFRAAQRRIAATGELALH